MTRDDAVYWRSTTVTVDGGQHRLLAPTNTNGARCTLVHRKVIPGDHDEQLTVSVKVNLFRDLTPLPLTVDITATDQRHRVVANVGVTRDGVNIEPRPADHDPVTDDLVNLAHKLWANFVGF